MTDFGWKKEKRFNWNGVTAIGTILLVVVTIGLVIVIKDELIEFRVQNKLTERSIRQTFRPLGIIEFNEEKFSIGLDKKNEYIFAFNKTITNKGNGILILVGWLSFFSDNEIDFSTKSVPENIRDGNITLTIDSFDTRYQEGRYKPLLPEDKENILVNIRNLYSSNTYYFYSIFLYKDQDNNLYDTVHLDYYRYSKPYNFDGDFVPEQYIYNEFFHAYSPKEHNELHEYISSIPHPMAQFIGKK